MALDISENIYSFIYKKVKKDWLFIEPKERLPRFLFMKVSVKDKFDELLRLILVQYSHVIKSNRLQIYINVWIKRRKREREKERKREREKERKREWGKE